MLFELFDQLLTIAVKVVYHGIGNSKINKNAPLHFRSGITSLTTPVQINVIYSLVDSH